MQLETLTKVVLSKAYRLAAVFGFCGYDGCCIIVLLKDVSKLFRRKYVARNVINVLFNGKFDK